MCRDDHRQQYTPPDKSYEKHIQLHTNTFNNNSTYSHSKKIDLPKKLIL